MLRWIAHTLIAIGTVGWLVTIFALEADAGKQMITASVLVFGVFLHHIWDEIYRNKDT